MKSQLLLLATLLLILNAYAQQITLKGQVTILNSKYHSGKTEFVSDAWVSADSGTSVVTDEKGRFSITLVGKSAGNATAVTVQKDGLEVVNPADLRQVILGRKRPLRVYLADPQGLAKIQIDLYEVSLKAMTARHMDLVALLRQGGAIADSVVTALQAELNREFEHRWAAEDFLTEQLKEAKKRLPETVRDLAKVNLDFASERYLEAWEAFCEGDIDGVAGLLEAETIEIEASKLTRELQYLASNKNSYQKAQIDLIQKARSITDTYFLKVKAHFLLYQYTSGLTVYEKLISLLKGMKQKPDFELAETYLDIAMVYEKIGSYSKAENYCLKALEIRRELCSPKAPELATTYLHLSSILMLKGNLEESILQAETGIALFSKWDSPDSLRLAVAYNDLAVVLQEIGRYSRALEIQEKAYKLQLKILPPRHYEIGTSCGNLATIYSYLGQFEEALKYHKISLSIEKEVYGKVSPETAGSLHNLAQTQLDLGNLDSALALQQASIEIQEKIFEEAHPLLATSYESFAVILHAKGNLSEALIFFQKSQQQRNLLFPSGHPLLALTHSNIAAIYLSLGRYDDALLEGKRAVSIGEDVLNDDNPKLAMYYNNLSSILLQVGEIDSAFIFQKKALDRRVRVLSDKDPDLLQSYANMASIYISLEEFELALENILLAIEVGDKAWLQGHPQMGVIFNNLGKIQHHLGNLSEAMEAQEKAIDIGKQYFGETHPNTGYFIHNWGAMVFDTGDFDGALKAEQQAHKIWVHTLPIDHPMIARSKEKQVGYHIAKAKKLSGEGNNALSIPDIESALALGFADCEILRSDSAFTPLRSHPKFIALLEQCEANQKATEQELDPESQK